VKRILLSAAVALSLLAPASSAANWTSINQYSDVWAGFSEVAAGNLHISEVIAQWTQPTVTCSWPNDYYYPGVTSGPPRVSVWVGMWADKPTMKAGKKGWLPQIGTVTYCAEPFPNLPYAGSGVGAPVWEMQSHQSGAGNDPQIGGTIGRSLFPGTSFYNCPPGPKTIGMCGNIIDVSSGDKIRAAIELFSDKSGAIKRTFEFRMEDITQNTSALGYEQTDRPVTIEQIAKQAGVIVEPAFSLDKKNNTYTDVRLAQFSTVKVTMAVATNTISPKNHKLYKWHMDHGGIELSVGDNLHQESGTSRWFDFTVGCINPSNGLCTGKKV